MSVGTYTGCEILGDQTLIFGESRNAGDIVELDLMVGHDDEPVAWTVIEALVNTNMIRLRYADGTTSDDTRAPDAETLLARLETLEQKVETLEAGPPLVADLGSRIEALEAVPSRPTPAKRTPAKRATTRKSAAKAK